MPDGPIGQSLRRLEDQRFLTGAGRYVADEAVSGALHAAFVRSSHAHAAIRRIDPSAALALPGVAAVVTGADLRVEGIGPLPCVSVLDAVDPLVVPDRHALPTDRARFAGEAVAMVLAETQAAARDGAEAVQVDYDPLPAIADAAAALAPGAPEVHPAAPGNLAFRVVRGDPAAVAAAMEGAAHVVLVALLNQRVHAAPLEPRAAVASWRDGDFELRFTGMGVHGIRRQLAGPVLGVAPERVRLVVPDVGGGFGLKNLLFPEYVVLLWAARRLGRAVRWEAGASEDCLASVHGRDLRSTARLALDAEGRFLALEVRSVADLGAWCSAVGPHCAANSPATAMGGIYAIPAITMEVRGAFTTTLPIDAYRGAGKPEANYIIERLIDAAARRCGFDAVELRRRNVIRRFPHATAMGMRIDGGNFAQAIDRVEALADRAGFPARRADSEARGLRRGLGFAGFLETARGSPNEWAAVRFGEDGAVTLAIGTHSNGQGHETSYAQVAAGRLGLPIGRFRVVQGDTAEVAEGNGHGGARSLHLGGGALMQALDEVLAKARRLAAHLLQEDPAALEFAPGRFLVPGTGRGVALEALAEAARDAAALPEGLAPGLDVETRLVSDRVTFPGGCHAAEVEVDPETGAVRLLRYVAVDDYGRIVNPMLTIGQVQGGLAQGIGQALLERVVFDPETAQPLSGSLMDYAVPRAADLPWLEVELAGVPTDANALGVKGCGQAGAIAAPQVVMAAVIDALGGREIDMPATPERVWRALRQ
jgi:carbon-monoxide dehydrogenase large subunit